METTAKKERVAAWALLAKATGYSAVYCRKVIDGDRSKTSKGGKVIMEKYEQLQKLVSNEG